MRIIICVLLCILSLQILSQRQELWGVTAEGGLYDHGVVFSYDLTNSTYNVELDFDSTIGARPLGTLFQALNGKLYGTAAFGGAHNKGVLFEIDPNYKVYKKVLDFDGPNHGAAPAASFVEYSPGIIYGITTEGGNTNRGTIFRYDYTQNIFQKVWDIQMAQDGSPRGTPCIAANGKIYCTTRGFGSSSNGKILEYDPIQDTLIEKQGFSNAIGRSPAVGLTEYYDGKLYGTTSIGGPNNSGTIYSYDPVNDSIEMVASFGVFGDINGSIIFSDLFLASDSSFYGMSNRNSGYSGPGSIWSYNPTLDTAYFKANFRQFSNTGQNPKGGIIQASNGKLYGLTNLGGAVGLGTLFQVDLTGLNFTTLTAFSAMNGHTPEFGKLIEITNCDLAEIDSIFSSTDSICFGESVALTIDTSARLRDASVWRLYEGNFNNPVNSNATGQFVVSPIQTTTYFVRGEGVCSSLNAAISQKTIQVTSFNDSIYQRNSYSLVAVDSLSNYQWIDCDSNIAISGATSREYVLTRNGNFALILSQNSCSDTSNCYSVVSVPVDEFDKANIRVFPNPSKGNITIELPYQGSFKVRIISIKGNLVYEKEQYYNQKIDLVLEGESGIYLLELENNQGQVFRKKVLKY